MPPTKKSFPGQQPHERGYRLDDGTEAIVAVEQWDEPEHHAVVFALSAREVDAAGADAGLVAPEHRLTVPIAALADGTVDLDAVLEPLVTRRAEAVGRLKAARAKLAGIAAKKKTPPTPAGD